ncbi:hypothetical protein H7171_03130 [Candidatus Saccharibacteria bacterium]|nr:hypothetical protein [Candidatus Saccharibacteria bacterium]
MQPMLPIVQSIITIGTSGVIIDIVIHVPNNFPNIIIVGLVIRSVDEAREH